MSPEERLLHLLPARVTLRTTESPAVPPVLSHSTETLWICSPFHSVAEARKISLCHPQICFAHIWSQEGWGRVALVLRGLFLVLC